MIYYTLTHVCNVFVLVFRSSHDKIIVRCDHRPYCRIVDMIVMKGWMKCVGSQATPTRQHIVVVVISIDVNRQTSFVENWTTTVFLRGSYERMRAGPVPQKGPKMTVHPGVFDVPDRREIYK